MDMPTAQTTIKALLTEIRETLDKAASVAAAAQTCATAGNVDQGVEIALDIEQRAYEASRPPGCSQPDQPVVEGTMTA
jgi:hypothetical protein